MGFPANHGGVCSYADASGLADLLIRMQKLHTKTQHLPLQPDPLLKDLADRKLCFFVDEKRPHSRRQPSPGLTVVVPKSIPFFIDWLTCTLVVLLAILLAWLLRLV
eukprot:m.117371 g.117371  ORF g.117371 m.117371 type:complete len:106 (+) comp23081_c0_seq4:747-1064(+)